MTGALHPVVFQLPAVRQHTSYQCQHHHTTSYTQQKMVGNKNTYDVCPRITHID